MRVAEVMMSVAYSLVDASLGGAVVDPVDVLLHELDPLCRARAHVELGLRSAARNDHHRAVWHLREAIDLDPTDEVPRQALRNLGEAASATEAQTQPQGLLGRLWNGIRRRA